MYWKKIRRQFPLAYKQVVISYSYTPHRKLMINKTGAFGWFERKWWIFPIWRWFDTRWLYDFFDGQAIFIDMYVTLLATKINPRDTFGAIIRYYGESGRHDMNCGDKWYCREKAEDVAFIKAFEILEKQLA